MARYRTATGLGSAMSATPPLLRIPVGVVIERRKARSPWADMLWRLVGVLVGLPDTEPWTQLARDGETARFYAGPAEIELYRSETENYRSNLASGEPYVWVALQETGGEPAYEIRCVTVDPAEGEGLSEPGQGIVDAVPMPEALRDMIAAFVAEYHVERPFQKRVRDRADPDALARRGSGPASR
jgi:Protein of unknown function (DUF3305)